MVPIVDMAPIALRILRRASVGVRIRMAPLLLGLAAVLDWGLEARLEGGGC